MIIFPSTRLAAITILTCRSLVKLLACETSEELEPLALNFTTTMSHFGQVVTVELGQGGGMRTVTLQNREEFVQKLYSWVLTECIAKQLHALREGFNYLIPATKLADFVPLELELVLSGERSIKVAYLREHTSYTYYTRDSEPVVWLWEVLEELAEDKRASFLQFVTGSGCVPASVDEWKLTVQRGGNSKKSHCTYSTTITALACSSRLLRPPFHSEPFWVCRLASNKMHSHYVKALHVGEEDLSGYEDGKCYT